MPPPPRKPVDNDPERDNKTQARAPSPPAEDPERAQKTQARASNPVAEDPERANKTQARAPRPPSDDPEKNAATQARAPNPLSKRSSKVSRAAEDPERANKTQARAPRPSRPAGELDEGSDYNTGQSYQPMEEDAPAGSLSLDGEGLDALDPEVGSSTSALPAFEPEDAGQDEDEEGADDANATHAGKPLKLEIIAGPDAGKKKKWKGVRMVIGRTPGVDFQLSDQSVSRRHIELVASDNGVLLRDLGSGNGTKVNGAKTAEKMLEHGDEISIGKTKIRFVDEVAAFQKAREAAEKKEAEEKAKAEAAEKEAAAGEGEEKKEGEGEGAEAKEGEGEGEGEEKKEGEGEGEKKPVRDRSKPVRRGAGAEAAPTGLAAKWKAMNPKVRLAIVGGVAFIFLLIVIGIATRPPPAPPIDPNKVVADQKMQDARAAIKEGDFEAAVRLVEEAEKLIPGIDKTKIGNTAREELAYVRALEEAKGFMENKRFEDARKALEKAQKGSNKSEAAKAKLVAELEKAEIAYKIEKIDEFIAAGEVEAAKSLLGELPVEQQSDPAAKIAAFEKELADQKAQEEKEGKAAAASAAARRKAQREEEIAAAFTVVERKFAGAEWDRAASECARVADQAAGDKEIVARARMLQATIPNFGRNFDEGMKKYRQGTLAQASKPLRTAHQLYKQMNLRANKYGQELEEKLGAASIAAGKEALIRDDLVAAWQNFRDAAKFDPGDSKARAGLDEVQAKAEDLFQLAYVQKDRDPRDALRRFKIVVQVTDPGSTVHEKAKNQIAAMQP